MPRRPQIVSLAAVLLASGVAATVALLAPSAQGATAGSLGSLAGCKGRYFGSATDNPELTDPTYTSVRALPGRGRQSTANGALLQLYCCAVQGNQRWIRNG